MASTSSELTLTYRSESRPIECRMPACRKIVKYRKTLRSIFQLGNFTVHSLLSCKDMHNQGTKPCNQKIV